MIVILEGVDNSGKSTLAGKLAEALGYETQGSEGPPKYKGEIEERIKRYLNRNYVIFDRHPFISNPIYDRALGRETEPISDEVSDAFASTNPLMIYCEPGKRGLDGYNPNTDTESVDHQKGIFKNYEMLLALYREWALANAHFIYRIGDNENILIRSIFNLAEDESFQEKTDVRPMRGY